MTPPRVLVVHNLYRERGGEERAVELQLEALGRAGVECRSLVRDSAALARGRAGMALLRGGEEPGEVARAVRDFEAGVVHVHNMHPLFGPRALAAAKGAGAGVVLHLHNYRLFCSIAVAFRDGQTCFRCRGRLTVPGLALNCRGSLPESAAYATALALHQPAVLGAVDRFVAPSRAAAEQLARLGVPAERLVAIPNYLPDGWLTERSRAAGGDYALFAGRLAPEKGTHVAIAAAKRAGVPLKVAGDGPDAGALLRQAAAAPDTGPSRRQTAGAPVEMLGRVSTVALRGLLAGAAMVVAPSLWAEVLPYSVLEAMGAGVPVIASRSGGLVELVGEDHCVERGDVGALADAMARLWADPELRRAEGDRLLTRARERFGEAGYTRDLLRVYEEVGG